MTEKNTYFFVKVILPDNQGWMPTLIVFEVDQSIKGIAVFTSWLKAEEFKAKIAELCSFNMEIVQLGGDGMEMPEFFSGIVAAVRSEKKALVETPVYVDPPDPYCKGLQVSHNNFQRFVRRCMSDGIKWASEPVSFSMYEGFTVCVQRRNSDGFFSAICFRGKYETHEALLTAIEEAQSTTDYKFFVATDFYSLQESAEFYAKQAIKKLLAK